ncbi:hypothetical protein EDD21DRAFT_114272 [Dissophora ornata]|nr:hypothetical protein EDD21DRAFT_114272 [Dissophora ornata]
MVEGTKWADKILDSLETMVNCGGFDEAEVKRRPRDIDMRGKYGLFMYKRRRTGMEHRTVLWSYEKFRYYLELCQGRSLVTGMKPTWRLDIDRNINTDIYDFDTILLMKTELNMAKRIMFEFNDATAFNISKAPFKPKWAAQILCTILWKLINDTDSLKDGRWEEELRNMRSKLRLDIKVSTSLTLQEVTPLPQDGGTSDSALRFPLPQLGLHAIPPLSSITPDEDSPGELEVSNSGLSRLDPAIMTATLDQESPKSVPKDSSQRSTLQRISGSAALGLLGRQDPQHQTTSSSSFSVDTELPFMAQHKRNDTSRTPVASSRLVQKSIKDFMSMRPCGHGPVQAPTPAQGNDVLLTLEERSSTRRTPDSFDRHPLVDISNKAVPLSQYHQDKRPLHTSNTTSRFSLKRPKAHK